MAFKDLTGQFFERWTVQDKWKRQYGHVLWLCKCRCGTVVWVSGVSLQKHLSRSCGCLRVEVSGRLNLRHGLSRTLIKSVHGRMLRYCENPASHRYDSYGARGIRVCAGWHDLAVFYADMGDAPDGRTLDRIDNNGHYSCGHCEECTTNGWPKNCKWSTPKEQARNTRRNKIVSYQGRDWVLAELAEFFGINYKMLWQHLFADHWDIDHAITWGVGRIAEVA